MHKFEKGQEVRWYRPGAPKGEIKKIERVIPQKPILPEYVSHPAVLFFTDGNWTFSWNVWPK